MYAAPLHLVKITHNQTYVMHREISFCLNLAQSKVKHEVPQRHNYKTSRNDGLHTKPRMSKWRADNTHTAAPTVQQARLLSSPRPQLLQPVGELPERRSNPLQVRVEEPIRSGGSRSLIYIRKEHSQQRHTTYTGLGKGGQRQRP